MNPQSRFWAVHKSLYIFLCSLLGMLLFFIIQRALALIWISLTQYDPIYALGFDTVQILALHFMTLLTALLIGGWYGVWLGLYWHELVYERRHDEMERARFQHPTLAHAPGYKKVTVGSHIPKATSRLDIREPAWEIEALERTPVSRPVSRPIRKPAPTVRAMPAPSMTMPVPKSAAISQAISIPVTEAKVVKPKPKKKAIRKTVTPTKKTAAKKIAKTI